MENKNKSQILKLRNIIINKITPLIVSDFVLVDIPNHRNIGDSLIWKGELEYFKNLKYKCLGQYNRYTFKSTHIKSSSNTILLHGGGNFGDIYPSSQNFKKMIVENFKQNTIIVLPQTIHYNDLNNLKKDFEIFNQHPELYICVRDHNSYNLIKDYIKENRIILTPDMAFCLDFDEYINNSLTGKGLFLNRTDAEKVPRKYSKEFNNENLDMLDWPTYNSSNSQLNVLSNYVEALDGKICTYLKHVPFINLFIHDSYGLKKRGGMDNHIQKGIQFINNYDKVYTTRLHGMILSILLGKEVVILDNSYGKNKGFYEAWLTDFVNLKLL